MSAVVSKFKRISYLNGSLLFTQNKHFEQGTELSAAENFEETAGPSASTLDSDPFPGLETQSEEERPNDLQEIKSSVLIDDDLSVSIIGERVLDKSRKQADKSRKSSRRNNRVVPTDCGNFSFCYFVLKLKPRLDPATKIIFPIIFRKKNNFCELSASRRDNLTDPHKIVLRFVK